MDKPHSAQTGRAEPVFPFHVLQWPGRCALLWPVTAWHDAACGFAPSSLLQAFLAFRCDLLQTKRLACQPCWHAQKMRAMARAEIANADLPNMKNIIINSSMILWLAISDHLLSQAHPSNSPAAPPVVVRQCRALLDLLLQMLHGKPRVTDQRHSHLPKSNLWK